MVGMAYAEASTLVCTSCSEPFSSSVHGDGEPGCPPLPAGAKLEEAPVVPFHLEACARLDQLDSYTEQEKAAALFRDIQPREASSPSFVVGPEIEGPGASCFNADENQSIAPPHDTTNHSCCEAFGVPSSFCSETPLPLPAEYVGLAIALCTLGFLEASPRQLEHVGSSRIVVRKLLTDAYARLHILMQKSRFVEERANHHVAIKDSEFWETERSHLLQQNERLQFEARELRKMRVEDGRANERVLSIFSSREQTWKAERRKLRNEQRRLWDELQRSFMEREALRHKLVERLRRMECGLSCEECDQRERLLEETKERMGEQELLIMATMEEAKAEQQEKSDLTKKLSALEDLLCDQRDKLSLEAESRAEDRRKHEATIEQFEARLRSMELEQSQYREDLMSAQSNIAAVTQEKEYYQDLVGQLSAEVTTLQKASQEREDILSAMMKKADADAEELHEVERELAVVKAKHMHAESEKEKWKRLGEEKVRTSTRKDGFKPRASFGSRADSGYDMVGELQKLHDVEICDLRSAFEDEVKLLQKKLNIYQERVADLEENVLDHMADAKRVTSLEGRDIQYDPSDLIDNKGLIVLKESMEADIATKQFQLSMAKTLLKQYIDLDSQREQEIEKWKKLFFASKDTFELFHKVEEHAGSMPKYPRRQDCLEMEKARFASKLEQRHWQEINAFERQMRARDERMEAFRWQLLAMENEAQRRLREVDELKRTIAAIASENLILENTLKEKEEQLIAINKRTSSCGADYEREIKRLQGEVVALNSSLTEKEMEYELSLAKITADTESEMQERECEVATLEAQLAQAYVSFVREKEEKQKTVTELLKEKNHLEHLFLHRGDTQRGVRDAIQNACFVMEKICARMCETETQGSLRERADEQQAG